MAELSYIDKFYDKLVRGLPDEELETLARGPASAQSQNEVVIEAEPPKPVEYPEGYKPLMQQSEIQRQNANEVLMQNRANAKDIGANIGALSNEVAGYKGDLKDNLERIRASGNKQYTPNADIESKLAKVQSDYDNIPEEQPRDIWTEAILSFGPAILGGLSGSSGQIAQKPATTEARNMYESRRKETSEKVKALREQLGKRHGELLKLKQSDREAFDKSQQRELDKLKAELDGTKSIADMSLKDLQKSESNLMELNKQYTQGVMDTSKDIAELETEPMKEAGKDKRAALMASQAQQRINLPSEGERKGAFQLGLMQQAEQNMKDLKEKYGNYPSMNNKWFRVQKGIASGMFGTQLVSDFLNSSAIDEPTRQQIQAELSFLEGIGRIQSGAAINVAEWNQMREQYFPTHGDSNEAVKVKEKQRDKALEGVNIIAGRAASQIKPTQKVVSSSSFPKIVRKGSQQATVSNEKELKEAQREGWK